MSDQYLRKLRLVVSKANGEGIDLSALKVRFNTKQADIMTPNTLVARIYNLSKETATKIGIGTGAQVEYNLVELQAGYENGAFGRIFVGDIKQTRYGRENPTDRYFDILAGDGDSAFNNTVVNFVLTQPTAEEQIKACVDAMRAYGITGSDIAPLPPERLPRGKVLYGMARDILRDIAESHGMVWCIVDGRVEFRLRDASVPGDAVVLTSKTGMIGLPEQTQDGIVIKCLLNRNIRVGRLIQLDNKSVQRAPISTAYQYTGEGFLPTIDGPADGDGLYRALVVEHQGDTRGTEWYSNLICVGRSAPPTLPLVARLIVPG